MAARTSSKVNDALCTLRARVGVLCAAIALCMLHDARAQSVQDLVDLSFEELSQIQVTSVSKRAEPLSRSPAAIYVISATTSAARA